MEPAPDDPWPHDLVLTVDRVDDSALELLWVRAAWSLRPSGDDLPPPAMELPDLPPTAERLRRDKGGWERAWPRLWAAAVERSASSMPPDPRRALPASAVDRLDLGRLVEALRGPTWRSTFGSEAFGPAYDGWRERLAMRVPHGASGRESPERLALDALVPAWRQGLRTVVTLPCTGWYVRTLGPETLLLTDSVREDPDQYPVALRSFGM